MCMRGLSNGFPRTFSAADQLTCLATNKNRRSDAQDRPKGGFGKHSQISPKLNRSSAESRPATRKHQQTIAQRAEEVRKQRREQREKAVRPAGPRVCVSSSVGRSTGRSLFNEYHAPASVVYCNQGVLLVGFGAEDAAALQTWFASIEPGFPVSCCSDELLGATLEEAVTASDGTFRHVLEWQECKELVPRVAIFSGMSQEETEGMAEFWSTSGTREPIFASGVDATKQKPLRAVLLNVAQAFAGSKAPPDEKLDAESLRVLLRQRMEAMRDGRGKPSGGPIVIRTSGSSSSSSSL